MSSDATPQPPMHPQYGPGAEINPYVEPGPPPMVGGQPPYQPPGAYMPAPPPPPRPARGRGAKIAIASILSVALLAAVGAVVLFKFVLTDGPEPAEAFPASASMYVEVNLDPSFDQTPKLLEHLNKFDDLDYEDTNDMFADLLDEAGLEGVDAEQDLSSWLGRRHGMATWEYDGEMYGVVSLASTDAGAAEDGLAQIRSAAGATDEEWAYSVKDDHVLMVVGEQGAAEALTAAENEAGAAPLSDSAGYDEARSWLDGDQLVVYWVDMEAFADMAELTGDEEDMKAFQSLYSGHMIAGLSAFDDGFELTYRLFGDEDDPWTGSEDLMANMGELPAGDLAVSAHVPDDLADLAEEWTGAYQELYNFDEVAAGDVTVAEPLTDAEAAERAELEEGFYAGTLSTDEEARFIDLENRFWMYGTEDEPNPTAELEYDDYNGSVEDFTAVITEFADLLAGSDLSLAAAFPADGEEFDPEAMYFSALLADDKAEDLQALIDETTDGEVLPDGVEASGSELSYTGGGLDGALADDQRFADFAEVAPDQAAVAVWLDLDAAAEASPDDFEGAEPLSAFAWAHGSDGGDGTGVVRLYIK